MNGTRSRKTTGGARRVVACARLAVVLTLSTMLASCGREIDGNCASPEIVEKAKTNFSQIDFEAKTRVLASLTSINKFIKSTGELGFAQSALIEFAAKNETSLNRIKSANPVMYATLAVPEDRAVFMSSLAAGDVRLANEMLLLTLAGHAEARHLFLQMMSDTNFCKHQTKCRLILQRILDGSSKDFQRLQDEIKAIKPRYGIFQIEMISFDRARQKLACESFVSVRFEGEDLEEKLRIRYVVEKPTRQELRVTVNILP